MSSNAVVIPTAGLRGARWPGLALAAALAGIAVPITSWSAAYGVAVSPLVVALLLGLAVAQVRTLPALVEPGLAFACRPLLRTAIVLLGLRIGLRDIAAVGFSGVAAIAGVVGATLLFGTWLGRRLGLSGNQSLLLAAGHAICGAAAIAAVDSVLRAKEQEVVRSLAMITLGGTVVMLLCPLLGGLLDLSPQVYGFWVGGSVHEVAQAVGAGFARGEQCGEAASLFKMVRVGCLLPVGAVVAVVVARREHRATRSLRGLVPWFVVGFAAVALIDAAGLVPAAAAGLLRQLCTVSMTVAMAALGLKSSVRDLASAGLRPLLVAGATTLFVSLAALGMALLVAR
ncbi:MAG: putative sulfate exporter family transporter [Planctomycetes bacterium]|nr:putative sulfate exporter family transporter [Planctomycetota bacterium]MCB9883983.1 putative sulfate exporter family transporter [Planctomycetota bacterium]